MKVIFRTVLFIALTFSYTIAYAVDEYQLELSVIYAHSEDDDGFEQDQGIVLISHFFAPVQTKDHPLAEAHFFERIGRVDLFLNSNDSKFGSTSADGLLYGATIEFAKPHRPLILRISYSKSDTEFNFPVIGDLVNKRYQLNVGLFLVDDLLIDFEHSRSELDRSIIGLSDATFKNQSYAFNLKWVEKLKNNKAIRFDGSLELDHFDDPTEDGDNKIASFSSDFYLNQRVSIGGGARINRGDNEFTEGETYSASVVAFLNPHFSIALFYQFFSARTSSKDDTTRYSTAFTGRF